MLTRKQIEELPCQGGTVIKSLDKLARGIGYNDKYSEPIYQMLEDNPGMVEAIYDFVLDHFNSYSDIEDEFDQADY